MKKNLLIVVAAVLFVFAAFFAVNYVKAETEEEVIFVTEEITPCGRDIQSRENEEYSMSTVIVMEVEEDAVVVEEVKTTTAKSTAKQTVTAVEEEEEVIFVDEEITPCGRDEQSREPLVEEVEVEEEVLLAFEEEVVFVDEEITPCGRDIEARESIEE